MRYVYKSIEHPNRSQFTLHIIIDVVCLLYIDNV